MNVLDRLDHEWERLCRCPRMAAALAAWGDGDEALRFPSLRALVEAVERGRGDATGTDRILAALARRAPADARAARVLLQLMLPGCKALVRRFPVGDRDERGAFVVTAAYDRIRTYPFERRPEKIAANVLCDVRHQLLRAMAERRPGRAVPLHSVPEGLLPAAPCPSESRSEGLALLEWAVRHGHIDRETAGLIAVTRVAGMTVAELAVAQGTNEQSLRKRRLRAEERLRAVAVAAR